MKVLSVVGGPLSEDPVNNEMSLRDSICIQNAKTHNLKSICVQIPRQQFVVLTGPSGSGKSSLAFDTIYAEAQRRFIESLSAYTRQYLERLPKPDVDSIEGLSPAIAIAQTKTTQTTRSTLATLTEIADYLRLLFTHVGTIQCPKCGDVLRAETPTQMIDHVLCYEPKTKLILLAPLGKKNVNEISDLVVQLQQEGFVRVSINDTLVALNEFDSHSFPKKQSHKIDVVIDRIVVKDSPDSIRERVSDSIELALRVGYGRVRVHAEYADGRVFDSIHSEHCVCERDSIVFPTIDSQFFSFNSPKGACPHCAGLGVSDVPNESRVIADPTLSLRQGAMAAWGAAGSVAYALELKRVVSLTKVDPDLPWQQLSESARHTIVHGTSNSKKQNYEGVLAWIVQRLEGNDDDFEDGALEDNELRALCDEQPCPVCNGLRLRQESLSVRVFGASIGELGTWPLPHVREHLRRFQQGLDVRSLTIAQPLCQAIDARLQFLIEIGLHYLTLNRSLRSLSGGEVARARLATQLASQLRGILYVLDEPTVGLHARDVQQLIRILKKLCALGNSILVVEHDIEVIRAADHMIDIGPMAGRAGGYLLANGSVSRVENTPASVTAPWLLGEKKLSKPARRLPNPMRMLTMRQASLHNLKNIDVQIPLGLLIAVTGVSGSGKSSLMIHTLLPALQQYCSQRTPKSVSFRFLKAFECTERIDKVLVIDQSSIGRSPRSNVATYIGVMTELRKLYAETPSAKTRGYKPSRFSTNVKGGRCEACRGEGVERIAMSFLPDVHVACTECQGRRFNRETLEIRFRGSSIADVLSMTVDEAYLLFEPITPIRDKLSALRSAGLGYVVLGQATTTLSGGEAQRIKLAMMLARKTTSASFYILDEPTTGLHMNDIDALLNVLIALRDQGHSVLVIEHNIDLVACADWVIDLGPEGGEHGGFIVAEGPPETIVHATESRTAPFLAQRFVT